MMRTESYPRNLSTIIESSTVISKENCHGKIEENSTDRRDCLCSNVNQMGTFQVSGGREISYDRRVWRSTSQTNSSHINHQRDKRSKFDQIENENKLMKRKCNENFFYSWEKMIEIDTISFCENGWVRVVKLCRSWHWRLSLMAKSILAKATDPLVKWLSRAFPYPRKWHDQSRS